MTAKATTTRARTPRKPVRASTGDQGSTTPQQAPTGRRRAPTKTTAKGPASDDAIRAIVAATATDDDDQAKAKRADTSRAATKPAKPARPAKPATPAKPVKPTVPTKVQANGKPTTTFKGRPTGNVQTVAARVKELNLRVRGDADIDGLAARLRATPDAVRQWLDNRSGSRPAATDKPARGTKTTAKTTAKAKAKTTPAPSGPVVVGEEVITHPWADKTPDYLRGCSLVVKWSLDSDGFVWSQLVTIRDQDGHIMRDAKDLPLDFRRHQDRDGNNRATKLKGSLDPAALRGWLVRQGLATPADIETNTTK